MLLSKNVNFIYTNKFKTVSICAVIRMPLERKYVTYNALLPYVLKHSSEKYNSIKKINDKMYELYGAFFDTNIIKKGEEQIIQFFIEVIDKKEYVEKAIEFLSEVITKPDVNNNSFLKNVVELEKENLKAEILSRKDNKKEFSKLKCIEIMCKNEPFGIYGDGYADDLDNINEKNLYEHYKNIMEKYNVDFYGIGNVSEKDFKNYINKYFKQKYKRQYFISEFKEIQKNDVKNVTEEENLSQGKLCVGFRTNVNPVSDDFFNLLVMNEIFGGSADSLLFKNVREKNGLCYYINSFIYKFKSIILVQAGIKKDDFDKTISLIKDCIDNIKNNKFSENDLKNAISGIIKKYESINDYPESQLDFLLSQNMLSENISIQKFIDKIKKVSLNDVSEIANKIFIDTIYFLC